MKRGGGGEEGRLGHCAPQIFGNQKFGQNAGIIRAKVGRNLGQKWIKFTKNKRTNRKKIRVSSLQKKMYCIPREKLG